MGIKMHGVMILHDTKREAGLFIGFLFCMMYLGAEALA